MNERLYRALLAVFGDGQTFTAADILKRSGFVAAPKFRELRLAVEAILGPKLGAIKIGKWLEAHRDTEAGELRLSGEYDSHNKRWNYCVFTMATIEEIESELQQSAQRFVEQREQKLAGKGLDRRLKQGEKDLHALESLDEQRRTFESDRKYKERKAENVTAQQIVEEVKKPIPKHIYLAPARGYFLFENKTEKLVSDFRELGFDASIGYLSASRFVIWIDGDPDLKELKWVAERFLIKINETEKGPATSKSNGGSGRISNIESNPVLPACGYWPEQRLLDAALIEDHARNRGVRRPARFLSFKWPIF